MKNKKKKNPRLSNLKKGKIKGVGFFEGIGLKIRGCMDGANNLPRDCGDGKWSSPHLEREIRSYDEFSSRMWGQLQIEEEEEYTRLGTLMDSLIHTKEALESAKSALAETLSYERGADNTRRHGESKLTDAQITARRANERAAESAPLRNRIDALRNKLTAEAEEFFALRNKIIEYNNSTGMICARVRDHLFQRINVYWNSALLEHSEKDGMPVVPSVEVTSRAEEVYTKHHEALMQRAELFGQSLSEEEKEAT